MIKLKSVGDLLGKSFVIPSYQRGYRWREQEVTALLNDIWDFIQQNPSVNHFYCLQPLVVYEKNESWFVIDGQQRLTTIFLLLKSLEDRIDSDIKNYVLKYETREDSQKYLTELNESKKDDNIDYFYIYNALNTIREWFREKSNIHRTIKNKFSNILLEQVKVIWYSIENHENEIKIFTRINMGKIALTNSELIKALLLNNIYDNNEQIKERRRLEFSLEWDSIEYKLQDDSLWYFLSEQNNKETRIELILDLLAVNYKNEYRIDIKKDDYYSFHVIYYVIKNNNKQQNIWDDIRKYFRILNEWFENRELFHKIGFLLTVEKNIIQFLLKNSEEKSKSDFLIFIDNEIKKTFKGIDINKLEYGDKKTKPLLLLFNIQSILNNKESNIRFQFDRYKNDKFDIEHIRSQKDKIPSKVDEKKSFIAEYGSSLNETEKENYINNSKLFIEFYNKQRKEIEGDEQIDKSDISNLALLDASTNRSYKNSFFRDKRKVILERDMDGTFIPICTRNVFLKYYTKDPKNLHQWTTQDAEDYMEKIKQTLHYLICE